jgi:hypothetical protein
LSYADVDMRAGQDTVVSFRCDGPWALVRARPGRYRVEATINGERVASTVNVPKTGNREVVMRFKQTADSPSSAGAEDRGASQR